MNLAVKQGSLLARQDGHSPPPCTFLHFRYVLVQFHKSDQIPRMTCGRGLGLSVKDLIRQRVHPSSVLKSDANTLPLTSDRFQNQHDAN